MEKELTNSEREVIRLLKSPIFTEKQVEETLRTLSNQDGHKHNHLLSVQGKILEGFLEAVRCIVAEGIPSIEMYNEVDQTSQLARLARLNGLCDVCDSESCAYNNEGICKFPLVHGKAPTYTDHDGCIDSIVSERNGGTYHDV